MLGVGGEAEFSPHAVRRFGGASPSTFGSASDVLAASAAFAACAARMASGVTAAMCVESMRTAAISVEPSVASE